jgi:hypothetical protein
MNRGKSRAEPRPRCEEKVQTGFTASFQECTLVVLTAARTALEPMSRSTARLFSMVLAVALVAPTGHAMAQSLGGLLDRGGAAGRDAADRAERTRRMEDRHDRGEDHRALSDAVRRVERRTGGQVLSAERVPFDGRNVNRVKVIDSSGRVRVYMDDPQGQGKRQPEPPDDD